MRYFSVTVGTTYSDNSLRKAMKYQFPRWSVLCSNSFGFVFHEEIPFVVQHGSVLLNQDLCPQLGCCVTGWNDVFPLPSWHESRIDSLWSSLRWFSHRKLFGLMQGRLYCTKQTDTRRFAFVNVFKVWSFTEPAFSFSDAVVISHSLAAVGFAVVCGDRPCCHPPLLLQLPFPGLTASS